VSGAPDRSVRPAQRGDEAAIASLQLRAWRSLMGDEALAAQGVTQDVLARRWAATLAAPRPAGSAALVALHANTIVGFALAGPDEEGGGAREAPDAAGHGAATQLYELVVDPDFRRAGHGSRLLAAVADTTSGQLRAWVAAQDEERQRFYASAGFAPAGAARTLGERTQHMWWAGRD